MFEDRTLGEWIRETWASATTWLRRTLVSARERRWGVYTALLLVAAPDDLRPGKAGFGSTGR